MLEKDTVILDLDDYNDMRETLYKLEKLIDESAMYDSEGKSVYFKDKAAYIEINKQLLMDLLDKEIDDIRLV